MKHHSEHQHPHHVLPIVEVQPVSSQLHKHASEQQYQQQNTLEQQQRQQDYALEQERRQHHHFEQLQRPQRPQHRVRSQTIVTGPTYMGHDRRKSRRQVSKSRGPPDQHRMTSTSTMNKKTHQLAMIGHDPETGEFDVSLYHMIVTVSSNRMCLAIAITLI